MAKNQLLSQMIDEIKFREKLSQSQIAERIGVSSQHLSDVKNGRFPFSQELSDKLYEKFTYLRKPEEVMPFVNERGRKGIPLVTQYAYGGYLTGYGDPEYLESLPMVDFTPDREMTGNWLAFEVKGDSMDDGSRDAYGPGDIVITREVMPHLWKDSPLHYKRRDFILVCDDGILIKRISDHDVENHIITIHSLNPDYPDRQIDLAHVRQIFSIVESRRQRGR